MHYQFKSQGDASSAAHHLRVAAERYDEHVASLAKEGASLDKSLRAPAHYQILMKQFEEQAKQARRIADEIEEAN